MLLLSVSFQSMHSSMILFWKYHAMLNFGPKPNAILKFCFKMSFLFNYIQYILRKNLCCTCHSIFQYIIYYIMLIIILPGMIFETKPFFRRCMSWLYEMTPVLWRWHPRWSHCQGWINPHTTVLQCLICFDDCPGQRLINIPLWPVCDWQVTFIH